MLRRRNRLITAMAMMLLSVQGATAMAQFTRPRDSEPALDWPMETDPSLPMREAVMVIEPKLKDLWLRALDRPDVLTRVQAATAIGKAYQQGSKEMLATAPKLISMLKDPQQNQTVKIALVQTLVLLDARQSADVLLEQNSGGDVDMVLLTDPALAAWNHEPAKKIWLGRLDGRVLDSAVVRSAIRSLGAVKDSASVATLLALAENRQADVGRRIEAAKSIHAIGASQAIAAAERLLKSASTATPATATTQLVDRLVAAHLLSAAAVGDAKAAQLLGQLLATANLDSSVSRIALVHLISIAPKLALEQAGKLSQHADSELRIAISELWSANASEDAIKGLTALLGDPVMEVRRSARESIKQMAAAKDLSPALLTSLKGAINSTLSSSNWQAAQQAAVLSMELKQQENAPEIIKILTHAQPAVRLAAVTALRHFISDEKVLLALRERATALAADKKTIGADAELAQIFMGLGQIKDEASGAMLTKAFAKNAGPGNTSRAAAIWALGHLHEGKNVPAVATALVGRINDNDVLNPEDPFVKQMAVVTLARMKAPSAKALLEKLYKGKDTDLTLSDAACWGLNQMDGTNLPVQPIAPSPVSGWFLEFNTP